MTDFISTLLSKKNILPSDLLAIILPQGKTFEHIRTRKQQRSSSIYNIHILYT